LPSCSPDGFWATAGPDGKGRNARLAPAIVAVGQVQKPLLHEWVGLGRDIPNFPGALLVKIVVHENRIFL
jgi:hypothetical protein